MDFIITEMISLTNRTLSETVLIKLIHLYTIASFVVFLMSKSPVSSYFVIKPKTYYK